MAPPPFLLSVLFRLVRQRLFFLVGLLALTGAVYALGWHALQRGLSSSSSSPPPAGPGDPLLPLDVDALPKDAAIYFLETLNITEFNPRFLCAYESAALRNPTSPVYVIQGSETPMTHAPGYLRAHYPNLHFVTLDYDRFVRGSPLERIWSEVKTSFFFRENISDTVRMLLLFRRGGHYMDSDMIVLREKPSQDNLIVTQRDDLVNNAFLKFQAGHPFVNACLQDMGADFHGSDRGYQGPKLVSRIIESRCPDPVGSLVSQRQCSDLEILPPEAAYPFNWQQRRVYLDPASMSLVREKTSNSYAAHYWNHALTDHGQDYISTDQPLYQLFAENCPQTERARLRAMIGQLYYSSALQNTFPSPAVLILTTLLCLQYFLKMSPVQDL